MSVNKCIFIGNMGRDAEVRTTETGIKVAQFRREPNGYPS